MFFMSVDSFKRKITRFIEGNKLFSHEQKLLVALSGGADSVALLLVLKEEGYSCQAAHCNFHLRGQESDRDEMFVRNLCAKLNVSLHVADFQTVEYSHRHGISIEMAARELRYDWFEEVRTQENLDLIAVAHHRDDSVETLLLNLMRGTGIAGLTGIRPVNGKIVRPLLNVSHEEILQFLADNNQDYVTDSSNLQDEYTRNKIRLDLLPRMREINPSVNEAIAVTAQRMADAERVYRKEINAACRRVVAQDGNISIRRLLEEESPKAVLYEMLKDKGFNSAQIDDIYQSLSAEPGRLFRSKTHELLKDRKVLMVRRYQESKIPALRVRVEVTDGRFDVPKDKRIACLDADKLPTEELEMRLWRSGDRFIPYGMKGFKSVRNYLRDEKFSLFDKMKQCVVCSGGEIVWLVGERIDNRYRVTDKTRRVMVLATD